MSTQGIALLGSTGSIGVATLEIISQFPHLFHVAALAVDSNIALLEKQIALFSPKLLAVYNSDKAKELQKKFPHLPVIPAEEGLIAAATHADASCVVAAMSGSQGLKAIAAAAAAGKKIALANKEVLVCGGELITSIAKKNGATIIPVDSEHSAIFQCLQGQEVRRLNRIILTASGGPFLSYTPQELANVTPAAALNHPNWKMGKKITIDCSTLMNKGLEMIEAHWLFSLPPTAIDVVIHPQSIIHSMVEFIDCSILAQLSQPTMLLPIQYALTYPDRLASRLAPFDFTRAQQLQFLPVETNKFRCLSLAYDAVKEGKSLPAYMNAVNEILVERFLASHISWNDIATKLEKAMEKHLPKQLNDIEEIIAIEKEAKISAAHL